MVFVWRRRCRKSSKRNSSEDQTRDIVLQNQTNQTDLQSNQYLQRIDENQVSSMHEKQHQSNFPNTPPPYVSDDLVKRSQERK